MSRTQATVYLVALPGYYVSFVLVAVLGNVGGFPDHYISILVVAAFFSCFAILAVAGMRVQRGEVAAERDDVLLPIMVEYILMSFGARLPLALASLGWRSPA